MAEGEGFEPSRQFPAYTLSKRAPSAARPPLLFFYYDLRVLLFTRSFKKSIKIFCPVLSAPIRSQTIQVTPLLFKGEGVRSLETVSRLHAFQACAFSRSATPPVFLLRPKSFTIYSVVQKINKDFLPCFICSHKVADNTGHSLTF